MKLLVFSPLPPSKNGIAEYVAEQIPYLARDWELTVVIADGAPIPTVSFGPRARALRWSTWWRQRLQWRGVPRIYHIGNNQDHVYMLAGVHEEPGLVALHDVNLHYLMEMATLRSHGIDAYAALLAQVAGRLGVRLASQVKERGWKDGELMSALPAHGSIIDAAHGVLVHSRWAAERVVAWKPDVPISVVPHHSSPQAAKYARCMREQHRAEIGIPRKVLLLTSIGFIHLNKRIPGILRILATMRRRLPPFRYVLCGEARSHEYDAVADIKRLGLDDCVHVTGWLDNETFWRWLSASDIILNLRWPVGGETSGVLTRALGAGRCCIVTDAGSFSELPDDIVRKVPPPPGEEGGVMEALLSLASNPTRRAKYELAAQHWVERHWGIQTTTEAYAAAAEASAKQTSRRGVVPRLAYTHGPGKGPLAIDGDSTLARLAGLGRLWRSIGWIPVGVWDWLVVAPSASEAADLKHVLTVSFGAERARCLTAAGLSSLSEIVPGSCTAALVCLPSSSLGRDPVRGFMDIARCLAVGGVLASAWTGTTVPSSECEPAGAGCGSAAWWRGMASAAGFSVDAVVDHVEGGPARSDPQQETALRARRTSRMAERWPKPWYPAARTLATLVDG